MKTLTIQKFSTRHNSVAKFKTLYYFRVVAGNNEIIAQSEGYTTARARNKTVALLLSAIFEVAP